MGLRAAGEKGKTTILCNQVLLQRYIAVLWGYERSAGGSCSGLCGILQVSETYPHCHFSKNAVCDTRESNIRMGWEEIPGRPALCPARTPEKPIQQ